MTSFAKQLNDEEGTGVDTKQKYSRFYWDRGKFSRIIWHPNTNLPELPINEGFSVHSIFRGIVSRVINPSISSENSCCLTCLDHDTLQQDNKAAWATSSDTSDIFEVGETLFYTKDGKSAIVKIVAVSLDDDHVLRFSVKDANGKIFEVTREHLRCPETPDIGWIPTSKSEYQQSSRELTDNDISKIVLPQHFHPCSRNF